MRIAMWSGPRNLSTAMMYSFAARRDFAVVDEPFYAAYLAQTGLDHPMRAEILAAQSNDPNVVAGQLTGSNPGDMPHFYQKHMTQHMVFPGLYDWMDGLSNIFLIRHPARVIASYTAKRKNPIAEDFGFHKQVVLFNRVRNFGGTPIVIDSYDIRANPELMLRKLCDAIGLNWDPAMLGWPEGGHKDDGVWATHWYGAAHRSTGFAGAEGPLPEVSEQLRPVLEIAMGHYDDLKKFKL